MGLVFGAAVTVILWGIRTVQFFTELKLTVRDIRGDVTLILNNHLPHIYERLGESYEVRQDQISYARGSRKYITKLGLDSDESRPSNGGHEGRLANDE